MATPSYTQTGTDPSQTGAAQTPTPDFMDRRGFVWKLAGGVAAATAVAVMTPGGRSFISSNRSDQPGYITIKLINGDYWAEKDGKVYKLDYKSFVERVPKHEISVERRNATTIAGLVSRSNPDLSDSELHEATMIAEHLYHNPHLGNLTEGFPVRIRYDPGFRVGLVSDQSQVPVPVRRKDIPSLEQLATVKSQ